MIIFSSPPSVLIIYNQNRRRRISQAGRAFIVQMTNRNLSASRYAYFTLLSVYANLK